MFKANKKYNFISSKIFVVIGIVIIIAVTVFFIVVNNNRGISKIMEIGQVADSFESPPFSEFYDFDKIETGNNDKALYKNISFSGKTSTKAFGKNSFSLFIEKKADDIGLDKLTKISMSGKIYLFPLRDTLKSALVLTISSAEGETKYWRGIDINGFDNLPIKEWFYVSGDFLLHDINLEADDKLSFYLWNNSDNDMLLDDLFIVYGEESERPGEKTLCDLTSASFNANKPPYPVKYFYKNNFSFINYNKSANNFNISKLFNENLIISGYFLDNKKGIESIIVFSDNSYIFHFCKDKNAILCYELNIPVNLNIKSENIKIISSDINGDSYDEVLIFDKNNNKILVYNIVKQGDNCTNNLNISLKEFNNSGLNSELLNNIKNIEIYSADFNKNNKSELLIVYDDGNWVLNEWDLNTWKVISKGNINYFSKNEYEINIYCGKINNNTNGIIIYGNNIKNKTNVFEIMHYSNSSKKFESISINSVSYNGYKSIETHSKFYFANYSNINMLLKFDNSQYFDFKALNFNNDSLKVFYNIDFMGYEFDNNPKYYEYLNILTGNFISPYYTSLISMAGCFSVNPDKKQIIINKPGFPLKIEFYSPYNNIY